MGFDLDSDKLHAWYGGNYYEPPPPPPPATTEGGDAPPVPASWARTHWGPKDWPGKRPGDALVMGRFLPVHRGHAWLFARAAAAVSGKVQLVVAGTKGDFIDVAVRAGVVQSLIPAPSCGRVVTALEVGRMGEPDGDGFWAPWLEWLSAQSHLKNVTTLVAADPKAERFAQLAKLEFVLVDRTTVSASGTSIRRAPWKYWNDIAPALRGPFTSCVSLVGPEGAGKTTLARKLREHFKTSLANEYTVDFLRAEGRDAPTKQELAGPIWNGQAEAWAQAKARATRFFIADSDHLTLALWSRRLSGTLIKKEPQRPGLTLLLDDATPWLGPKDRDEPAHRQQMVIEFRRLLTGRGWPFHVLDGPREGRFDQAVARIEDWIRTNPMSH
jgi:HTH-type transcriptional repressor of NAD biosynthesis genes